MEACFESVISSFEHFCTAVGPMIIMPPESPPVILFLLSRMGFTMSVAALERVFESLQKTTVWEVKKHSLSFHLWVEFFTLPVILHEHPQPKRESV